MVRGQVCGGKSLQQCDFIVVETVVAGLGIVPGENLRRSVHLRFRPCDIDMGEVARRNIQVIDGLAIDDEGESLEYNGCCGGAGGKGDG